MKGLMKSTCPECGERFEDILLFWARQAMEHHRAEAHGSNDPSLCPPLASGDDETCTHTPTCPTGSNDPS